MRRFLSLVALVAWASPVLAQPAKPNIVVILTDDRD